MLRLTHLAGFGGSAADTTAPTITSASSVSVAGNTTLSFTITTNEAATITIGGTDAAQAELASNTLATSHTLRWSSNGTRDHDSPADSGANNVYDITLTATDAASNASSPQSFAITVTANVDPSFASVKLLLGFEGSDASTTVTDESGAAHGTASHFGNAQIDTAQFKFGSSSLLLDGSGDLLTYNDSADWNLGSGLFTIECWVRPATVAAGTYFIVGQRNASGSYGWVLWQSGAVVNWNVSTTGSDYLNDLSGGTLSANTWAAICVDYDGTKYRLYVDGTMVASSATARTINDSFTFLAIGANSGGSAFFYNGWIDEMRLTKGVARYASDGGYTPTTVAFPRS